jgi:GT2 family glycosyltransferase
MHLGSISPTLAAVVLNWNHTHDTIACVKRLQAWENPPLVWVADNGSSGDAAEQLQQELPEAHILLNKANLGFGGGNNAALAEVLAEWHKTQRPHYVLLLNNDAVLTESTAQQLLDVMQTQPRIALLGTVIVDTALTHAGGTLLTYGGKDVVRWIDTRHHTPPNATQDEIANVFYVPATAAILRTQALAQVGLLDTDYFFNVEMADWCARARALGWRTCVHLGTRISHDVQRSGSARHGLHLYYNVRNRFLFLHKQPYTHKTAWRLMWVWRAFYAAMTALVTGQWPRTRVLLLALRDGLAGKTGMAPAWLQPK